MPSSEERAQLHARRQVLNERIRNIDRLIPDGYLLVYASVTNGGMSKVVPLVMGARQYKFASFPTFSVIYDGHSVHIIVDHQHVLLRNGNAAIMFGFFSGGIGSVAIARIHNPDNAEFIEKQFSKVTHHEVTGIVHLPLLPKQAST